MVFVRPIAGKKLLGTAGPHTVVTDRKAAEGGTDQGCTSGELLLLAMASCATGSVRNALAAQSLPNDDIRVEVDLVPPKQDGARDGILITVLLPRTVLDANQALVVDAAVSGGVVSRLKLGSEIDVRCVPLDDAQQF
jgi:organic hydroperoxide reductase OsmC/OhrA